MAIATFLNGRAPVRLRGLQFLALSDAATVQRRTATSDAGGGATWAWADVVTVPCRIYPVTLRGRPAFVGGALDERSTHYVTLPAQTDVTTSDRVVIAGATYDVTMVPTRTGELTRPVEVMQT